MSSPEKLFPGLFEAVQMGCVFADSKTFPDCVPRNRPEKIMELWMQQKDLPDFDLRAFVTAHFDLPVQPQAEWHSDTSADVAAHIHALWPLLTRQPEQQQTGGSLIPLPHPYVVPGGRFGEIYYWDSYFTMLGLQVDGRYDLIRSMVDNFAYLIELLGFIPNGNRTYFLSRSQPPFFSLMVKLLAEEEGAETLLRYLPHLEREYAFWMAGAEELEPGAAFRRVVKLPDGTLLNRYYDDDPSPRPESYREDVELAKSSGRNAESLFGDLRAACESGWDFSSRWLERPEQLVSIRTTEILPVDLNCLLCHLEATLAQAFGVARQEEKQRYHERLAERRAQGIRHYFWNPRLNHYTDYLWADGAPVEQLTMAAAFPLFLGIASAEDAAATASALQRQLLRPGGFVTTAVYSGQQWDAPNGWAPLQWVAYRGLRNYGFDDLAVEAARRWVTLNVRVFRNTGRMMEKYDVENMELLAGGGEYPVQDGFGWTNGVLLRLLRELEVPDPRP